MKDNCFDIIILGNGISALTTAAKIIDGKKDVRIAIINKGNGASYFVDALNAVTPENPYGDTVQSHAKDMFEIGCYLNDKQLVLKMCQEAYRCVKILEKWGINFKKEGDQYVLHRTSGSSFPRTLFQISMPVGKSIILNLQKKLIDKSVKFINKTSCIKLLIDENKIIGITTKNSFKNYYQNFYAPIVVIAWGGIGNLYPYSTYPNDIDGSSIAIAFDAGLELLDLEFVEFEPLVVLWPFELKGQPCPTALLGDNAHLRNKDLERFILKWRNKGESGAPKTLINRAGVEEIAIGKGTIHGGFYYDLRDVPQSVLENYRWFYQKLKKANINYQKDLLEVGLAAHSHSGGIKVNESFQTKVNGLYAVGEAVGGIHGACRLGGNSSTQALVSGIIAAEKILKDGILKNFNNLKIKAIPKTYKIDEKIYQNIKFKVQGIINKSLGFYRNKKDLEICIKKLKHLLKSDYLLKDTYTKHLVLSALLIANSALLREESRGNHNRLDFPNFSKDWQCSIVISSSYDGDIKWEKIIR